ncbi:hypothetical protein [Ruminococcus sp.]|uniref:hypothetical protein n=1 Tax=Ruminococcus sp. TaxID=41978 RepID=UPI001B3D2C16|nr:hypothetical protein [Ruminococcus sp.]MBP5432700.1 hypothetical protein [Ruminococcus sp.]
MPYCTQCGRKLEYGEKCSCTASGSVQQSAPQQYRQPYNSGTQQYGSSYGQQQRQSYTGSSQQQYGNGYSQQQRQTYTGSSQQQYGSSYGQPQRQSYIGSSQQQYGSSYGQPQRQSYTGSSQQQYGSGYSQQQRQTYTGSTQQQDGSSYSQQQRQSYTGSTQQQDGSNYGQPQRQSYTGISQQYGSGYGQPQRQSYTGISQQYGSGYGQQQRQSYNSGSQQYGNGYGQPYSQNSYPYYGQTFTPYKSKSPAAVIAAILFSLILVTFAAIFIPPLIGGRSKSKQQEVNAAAAKLYDAATSAIDYLGSSGENIRGTYIISSDSESNVAVPFEADKFYETIGYYFPPDNVEYFFVVRKGRVEYLAASEDWTYRKAAVGSCPQNDESALVPRLYSAKGNGPSAGKKENLDEIYWDTYDKLFDK